MKRIVLLIALLPGLCFSSLSQSQEERMGLRLIAVRSEAEATNLRAQVLAGASFEALARQHSLDTSAGAGGYIGFLRIAELTPELQQALRNVQPNQTSNVTRLGGEYVLLQRLSLEEATFITANDAGIQAFRQGRYDEAARNFQEAVQYAEKLTPVDYRLEDSLHGLAESYRLLKKDSEAEPLYRRYLAIRWGGPTAPEVLDRFSALVALSYFRDSQFDETLRKFNELLDQSPLSEELYEAMSGILFKAELMQEAETLMARAAELFPNSRDVHYHLAQIYLVSEKTQKALEVFERLRLIKAPSNVDPSLDRLQQSVVYQKIGSIQARFGEFAEAATAYERALELTPDSAESRLGLGDLHIRQGQPEDALTEYNRVIAANPQNVTAQIRVADANLRMGRWADAGAAAAKVLTLDPKHLKAHFIQATVLVRMGRQEEGDRALEQYRKLEEEARSETDRARDIVVLNRGAAAKLLQGHGNEAIETFREMIQSYPDAPSHYLNLGTAQSKLGQHKEAIETFQKMITLGMDSFVVYRNLAREFEALGDADASLRYEAVYLQNMDVALGEALSLDLE